MKSILIFTIPFILLGCAPQRPTPDQALSTSFNTPYRGEGKESYWAHSAFTNLPWARAQDKAWNLGKSWDLKDSVQISVSGGVTEFKTGGLSIPDFKKIGGFGNFSVNKNLIDSSQIYHWFPDFPHFAYQSTLGVGCSYSGYSGLMQVLGAGIYGYHQLLNSWFNPGLGLRFHYSYPIFRSNYTIDYLSLDTKLKAQTIDLRMLPQPTMWMAGLASLQLPFGNLKQGLIANIYGEYGSYSIKGESFTAADSIPYDFSTNGGIFIVMGASLQYLF